MMGVGVGWVTQVIECFDFRLWVPMRAAVAGGTVMLAAQRFSGVFPHSLPPPSLAPPGERGSQQPYVANAVCGVAFTRHGQHSNLPGTS